MFIFLGEPNLYLVSRVGRSILRARGRTPEPDEDMVLDRQPTGANPKRSHCGVCKAMETVLRVNGSSVKEELRQKRNLKARSRVKNVSLYLRVDRGLRCQGWMTDRLSPGKEATWPVSMRASDRTDTLWGQTGFTTLTHLHSRFPHSTLSNSRSVLHHGSGEPLPCSELSVDRVRFQEVLSDQKERWVWLLNPHLLHCGRSCPG